MQKLGLVEQETEPGAVADGIHRRNDSDIDGDSSYLSFARL